MYLVFCSILILSTILSGRRYKYAGVFISSVIIALFYSQRSLSVGNDTWAYNGRFDRIQAGLVVKKFEILYHLIFQYSYSFRHVLFYTSFISLFSLQMSIVNMKLESKLSFLILICSFGFLNIMVDQSRQILALSVFLMLNALSRRSRLSVVNGIFAALIHKSMLLLAFFRFINIKRWLSGFILVVATILAYYLGKNFIIVKLAIETIESGFSDTVYVNDRFLLSIIEQSGNLILLRFIFAFFLALYALRNTLGKGITLWLGLIVQILSSGFMPLERIGDVILFYGVYEFVNEGLTPSVNRVIITIFYLLIFSFYIYTQVYALGKHGSLPWEF